MLKVWLKISWNNLFWLRSVKFRLWIQWYYPWIFYASWRYASCHWAFAVWEEIFTIYPMNTHGLSIFKWVTHGQSKLWIDLPFKKYKKKIWFLQNNFAALFEFFTTHRSHFNLSFELLYKILAFRQVQVKLLYV
jgi:hypothetical protein